MSTNTSTDTSTARGTSEALVRLYGDVNTVEATEVPTFAAPALAPGRGIDRDQYGRPKITPPEGGKPVPYTRASSEAGYLTDGNALRIWQTRRLALALARFPDLLLRIAVLDPTPDPELVAADDDAARAELKRANDDKAQLDDLIERALDRDGTLSKADWGTALHKLSEPGADRTFAPAEALADLAAYDHALASRGIVRVESEVFVVSDEFRIAGTTDGVFDVPGWGRMVGDLKGLALDTPLATPGGWTTMGEVQVGEQVFGADGRPTAVTVKSDVKHLDCYRVTFDDGTSIVCDEEHLWQVETRNGTEVLAARTLPARLVSTVTGQRDLRVLNARALDLLSADLPLDPYVLGVWIGDGKHTSGEVTKPDDELFELIEKRGFTCAAPNDASGNTRTVLGLRTHLRTMGLLGDKRVPREYLRGSYEQRLDLLRGLMDTDGTWNRPRKRATFGGVTDQQVAEDVFELVASLGWRPLLSEYTAHGFGKTVTAWSVSFAPLDGVNPFALSRKADLVEFIEHTRSRRRLIVSVEQVETVPTQCIGVDAPDHLYLAGRQMVPTHNTGQLHPVQHAVQLAAYAGGVRWVLEGDEWVRAGTLDVRQDVGLLVHLVKETGVCELFLIDLEHGRRSIALAEAVRDARRSAGLARPFDEVEPPHPLQRTVTDTELEAADPGHLQDAVAATNGGSVQADLAADLAAGGGHVVEQPELPLGSGVEVPEPTGPTLETRWPRDPYRPGKWVDAGDGLAVNTRTGEVRSTGLALPSLPATESTAEPAPAPVAVEYREVTVEAVQVPLPEPEPEPEPGAAVAAAVLGAVQVTLDEQVATASSRAELDALWREHSAAGTWLAQHTELARARTRALGV